jgi:stage II sporulation protein D
VLQGEERQQMTMADYLFGVVAAEMPARFAPEALRAQAVAARTFALYRAGQGKHDGAVCTDPACCQARLEESALRERWGADFEANAAKLRAAVSATDGLILTWEGAPILAAFHACSGGMTETGLNVFGLDLPYLQSVPGMEDPAAVPDYETRVELGPAELSAVLAAWDEAAAVASEGPLLTDPVFSPAGRLLRVKLCGVELTGQKLRQLFGLRSTLLSWRRTEEGGLAFTVTGYGHGAGMSQYGAQAMAAAGESCETILAHFYPGTTLETAP